MKILRQFAWLFLGLSGGLLGADSVYAADPLATVQHRAQARGYRVRELRWDPILQQQWAVLESVLHPEFPLLAELTASDADTLATGGVAAHIVPVFKFAELAVRSGDSVVLWSAEQNVRMEMVGVAEGNASVGDRIQVRVRGAGVNGDTGWRVSGIVRGPGSVEIER